MTPACNASTWEAETGESGVQSQTQPKQNLRPDKATWHTTWGKKEKITWNYERNVKQCQKWLKKQRWDIKTKTVIETEDSIDGLKADQSDKAEKRMHKMKDTATESFPEFMQLSSMYY